MLLNLSNTNEIEFNIYDVTVPVGDTIKLKDLDFYSKKAFPPCMKALYSGLKNQHHLKHFGRLQLGLFIKGLGLSLDETIMFWKQEFTKKPGMDAEKFEKNYAYNIRHMFGKEGKQADYKPWSCNKIINQTTPGAGELNGCPFKTFSEENLRQLLNLYEVNN
jgi:DNA primase large subunit